VLSVAFSPDGQLLASGSWDSNIKLWSIPEQQEIATLRGHVQGVRGVAFSPDGQLLASGEKTVDMSPWAHGGITGIKVWSVSSRREIATVKGAGPVAFSPNGQLLAGRVKEGIRLWNVDGLISR
jgi:WD40 repeat protein